MSESIDAVVIGAGVVGLAVARSLARTGLETLVLEAASHIGSETSSRNSEVIHAGIYYQPGSLKARHCVDGKLRLYNYCETHGVPYQRCGKLIVATSEAQVAQLSQIKANAVDNGVTDLRLLDQQDAQAMEPALHCLGALHSPSTGIIDSHQLMLALQGELEAAGGMIAFGTSLLEGQCHNDGITLVTADATLEATRVVNCAGLHAQTVAKTMQGLPAESIPPTYYAKGNYYTLESRAPFNRLIYPVPEPGGLGVHLTLDLGGRARFGPDVEWTETLDYEVDPARSDGFYAAIRQYWPDLPDHSLAPGYSGIRPKITGPGEPAGDFMIQGPDTHGVAGLVNLFGIESPGLTSSLAIADHVTSLLSV